MALTNSGNLVERQVRHLSRLVDDLLEVARIGQGKVQLKPEPLELNPLLLGWSRLAVASASAWNRCTSCGVARALRGRV